MRSIMLLTTILLLCAVLAACTIRKQDEIECGLPDGSSFILRAKYDWDPFARFIPHAAERLNRTGLNAYYRAKGGKSEIGPIGGGRYPSNYNDIKIAQQLCSPFGLINGVPYVALARYKINDVDTFTSIKVDDDLFFNPHESTRVPKKVREALKSFDASYGGAAIIWHPEKLIIETGIVKKSASPPPHPTIAVYRIESLDGGQTWINPHVTTGAEAFELGKTSREQCFVARLIRIDKQKIEAHFPPCPISEALPN